MREEVKISGELRTLENMPEPNGEKSFIVHLGDMPLDVLVAEHFENGGYLLIKMLSNQTARQVELHGPLDVFVQKNVTQYYENGWLITSDRQSPSYRVHLAGRSIITRVAEFFPHPAKRTYYDHGRRYFHFIKMW